MGKTDRLNKQIQRLVAQVILYEMNDPRLKFVTVTRVELTEDFHYCTVYVSVLGDAAAQRTTMRGLEHARGFIQREVGKRLALRHTPQLKIVYDPGIEKSFVIAKRIEEAIAEDRQNHPDQPDQPDQPGADVPPAADANSGEHGEAAEDEQPS